GGGWGRARGGWPLGVPVAARPTPPRDPGARARRPAAAQRVVLVCVRLLTRLAPDGRHTGGRLDSQPAAEVGDARDLQPPSGLASHLSPVSSWPARPERNEWSFTLLRDRIFWVDRRAARSIASKTCVTATGSCPSRRGSRAASSRRGY